MKTWKLPEPPEVWVSELKDAVGNTYSRMFDDGEYWWGNEPAVRGSYLWSELLWQRGPLTGDE